VQLISNYSSAQYAFPTLFGHGLHDKSSDRLA